LQKLMDMEISLSVVIPCFNQGHYIDEAVDSVLSQTYQNIEIIIVNDGSTDPETLRILETYDKPKTRVIHTTNQGLAAARNNGIREASGRYILPLDGDDRIGPTYIEKAVTILDRNPGIGIIYCKAEFFGAVQKPWNLPEYSLDEMLIDNILFCSGVFRKSDWETVGGYRTDMTYGWEDYDFWLSLIERGALVHRIPEVLFYYRISPDSMIRTKSRNQKIDMFEIIFNNHLDFYKQNIRLWIDRLIDINVDKTRMALAQVYVDTGLGFNEKQSVFQYVSGDEPVLEFDISRFRDIRGLRLDPVNDCAVLHIHDMALIDTTGKQFQAHIQSHNAVYQDLDNYVFTSTDPHFLIEAPGLPLQSVSIRLEFISIGKDAFYRLLNLQNAMIVEKDRQISESQDQQTIIADKNGIIRDKDNHIHNIEASLDRIRHSRIWRTASFIREYGVTRPVRLIRQIRKGFRIYKSEGFLSLIHHYRLHVNHAKSGDVPAVAGPAVIGLNQADYERWQAKYHLNTASIAEMRRQISAFSQKPVFSILVPVYNVDRVWLEKAIQSVMNQVYENWELCLADDASPKAHVRAVLNEYAARDARIKVIFPSRNQGIAGASNSAASLATGDFIGLLDHDDELSPDALFEMATVINHHPDAGLIYSDEDKMDLQGNCIEPFFKPDYSPDMILSQNYICHFTTFKKSFFDAVGGFREGMNGSQDHDLVLRILEKTDQVHHIPKILYHWRKIPGSTAAVYDSKSYAWEAGRKAIQDTLKARNIAGSVFLGRFQGSYRVKRKRISTPLVSIIIPFRDQPDLLDMCLTAILEKTSYPHFEILCINNGSRNKKTRDLMDRMTDMDSRIRFMDYQKPFNYSAINNFAVSQANGEQIVLMNNDIQIIHPDWIETLMEHSQRPEVGAVGAKLLYPNGTVQHVGIAIGLYGNAGHPHRFFHKDDNGYYARPHVIHNVSAVTGALMMVKKGLYLDVDGLDADNLGVAYNDVDFCLKLREKGYLNVFTPYCEAVHHESASRGYENTPDRKKRFEREMLFFQSRWKDVLDAGDPYYNVNLSLKSEDFAIRIG